MTTYAPDLAPELEPKVVHWQPPHPPHARAHLLSAEGATALALVALGALAIGALAVGALAVGRLSGGRGRFRVLDMDQLHLGRLRRRPF